MDGDRRRRARSFLLGGVLGASAALATARQRRLALLRRGRGFETPAGLAAFEGAPCFEDTLEAAHDEDPRAGTARARPADEATGD